MKKYMYCVLLLSIVQVQMSHSFVTDTVNVSKNQELTSININPTFQNAYSELMVPSSVIAKIQRALATSPVQATITITKSKKYYDVVFEVKNSDNKIIASKTFTAITDENRSKIPTTTSYLHTNFNYRLSMNPQDSSFKEIKNNPFTIEFNS